MIHKESQLEDLLIGQGGYPEFCAHIVAIVS